MAETSEKKKGKLEKIARFIVEKRKAIYLIYILLAIFSIFSSGWVSVNNTLTDYLGEETETSRGLAVMEEEFITYATAEVMIDNISYTDAEALCDELEEIQGVKEIAFDETEKHYADGAALFSVTFEGESDDPICETALDEIEVETADYDVYISAELGNTKADTIAAEMQMVMVLVGVIILSVLLFTSRTYMEVPVLLLTFGMAAVLNKGTNFLFGEISFVSNSVAIVLQLALAIDYAIILCHRYMEERENGEPMEAVIQALRKAIPEISGSSLTTLSGLAAMAFMHFKIGYDMSIILIKAILMSLLSVFTLMPGLLYSFSSKIDSTHHRNFVPQIRPWTKLVVKLRHITPIVFGVLLVVSFLISKDCAYVYSYIQLDTFMKNESQIAREKIEDTFTASNVLAVLIPSGEYEKEQALARDLKLLSEVDDVTGLATVEAGEEEDTADLLLGDLLTPRELAEFADIDVELVELLYTAYAMEQEEYGHIVGGIDKYEVPLIDIFEFIYEQVDSGAVSLDAEDQADLDELYADLTDGKEQLNSGKYSRLVMELNIPEESPETFAFLDTVRKTAAKYYGDDVLLVGDATSNFDLSSTFSEDNTLISILSILFVMVVLFFTFQSAGVPFILIMVIQGSIWMNFTYPTLHHTPIFFMSYLVVSSIQMGANIDYAIVITNRYLELRRKMPKIDAIKESLELAFPTIFTSGSIMAAAGTAIGFLSSDGAISGIGVCLGRGTLISIILVMGILPQLLLLGDFVIEKTSFHKADHRKEAEGNA